MDEVDVLDNESGADVAMSADEVAAWAAVAPLGSGLLTPWGALDPKVLSDGGRIDAVIATERLRAWADAQAQRLLAALAPAAQSGKGFVREEIGCALRLSPTAVSSRLHTAQELVDRLPATLALLETGRITARHAEVLVEATTPLDDVTVAAVEARVLARAPEQSVAAFRAGVHRAVLAADPRTAEERHECAVDDRRVCVRPVGDGMAELWAMLPADGAAALLTTLNAIASGAAGSDERTADQRRADALVDLATARLGGEPVGSRQGRRPSIQVVVAASTLAGADELPGELDGFGPIPAALARAIAFDPTGTWRRLLTDADGRLLDYGHTTYRPPQPLIDFVAARDQRCRFPGCTRLARRCDIDHQVPYVAGGPTGPGNCACLCPRHHHLKHEAGWTVTGDPADDLTWTSPTGHTYRSPPGEYPTATN